MAATGRTVIDMVDSEHRKQVLENRHYLKTVAEVLRLTAVQNISQRGHRETAADDNRGNFLEILECIAQHDNIVMKRIASGPQNAKYTHHSVQDAILGIMASMITDDIRNEVSTA